MAEIEQRRPVVDGRCAWCGEDMLYRAYHDNEWGKPLSDDRKLFELLILEGAQAGLNWLTILRKRPGYRHAFHGFVPEKVALMTDADVESLMANPGIIRNRAKIKSAISNARAFIKVVEECGSFENYILSFFPNAERIVNTPKQLTDIPATCAISDAISADMKRRGFKFFGSTICYAFLQSAGFINDHFVGCLYKYPPTHHYNALKNK